LSAARLQQSLHALLASLVATQTAVLALDDTRDPRNGNAIEGAGWPQDRPQLIRNVCARTAMLCVGGRRLCLAIGVIVPQPIALNGVSQQD
jgi:hypothetical protein